MFCSKCGHEFEDGEFCSKCGTKVGGAAAQNYPPQPPPPPPIGGYPPPVYPRPAPPHYAPGSYVERFHSFGGSMLFMIGIILFSAGTVLPVLVSFGVFSIFTLMIIALPVTGFWLIFAASKAPMTPEKSLTSLLLFKISIIIELVVLCLAALLIVIVAVLLFVAAAAASGNPCIPKPHKKQKTNEAINNKPCGVYFFGKNKISSSFM
jgi:hypothetical protein